MNALSDLSGDGLVKGFEQYLTGYPIDELRMYAFARTWYASEMSRPGCVWTHTLLIAFADLARFSNLSELGRYFRRPAQPFDRRIVRKPIFHFLRRAEPEGTRLHEPDDVALDLMQALYSKNEPVVISGDKSSMFEELILRIWSQQWPRLRRVFTFSTGSLSSRALGGIPFDVQVVPQDRLKSVRRTLPVCTVISRDEAGAEAPSPRDRWLVLATMDLFAERSRLRHYLRKYGADVPGQRPSLRALIDTFIQIDDFHEATQNTSCLTTELVNCLGEAFPHADEARVLKEAVLGSRRSDSPLPQLREPDMVRALLTTPHDQAFDFDALCIASRAKDMFTPSGDWNPEYLLWLLCGDRELNASGKRIRSEVMAGVQVADLPRILLEHRDLFASIIRLCPDFLSDPALWSQPRELQRATLSALGMSMSDERRGRIVAAMVEAETPICEEIPRYLGEAAVGDILGALNVRASTDRSVSLWRWARMLSEHQSRVVEWLANPELDFALPLVVFSLEQLGPRNELICSLYGFLHEQVISVTGAPVADAEGIELAAFALAAAIDNPGEEARDVVVVSFGLVHRAAMRSQLSWRAWQWLRPSMPKPDWYSLWDWDRAEKLRRALVGRFLQFQWSPQKLAEAANDEDARRHIAQYCRGSTARRELLRRSGLEE